VGSEMCIRDSVCLFLRDTNEQLVAATGEYWPDGFVPGAAIERLGEEPK
jgi:hypothetical protein